MASIVASLFAVSGQDPATENLAVDGPYGIWSIDAEQVRRRNGRQPCITQSLSTSCSRCTVKDKLSCMLVCLPQDCSTSEPRVTRPAPLCCVCLTHLLPAIVQRFFWSPVKNGKPRVTIEGTAEAPKSITIRGRWVRHESLPAHLRPAASTIRNPDGSAVERQCS